LLWAGGASAEEAAFLGKTAGPEESTSPTELMDLIGVPSTGEWVEWARQPYTVDPALAFRTLINASDRLNTYGAALIRAF